MTKSEARILLRDRLRTMNQDCSPIWETIEGMSEFKQAGNILLYWSMPSEVGTHKAIVRWSEAKKILLPKVSGENLLVKVYSPSQMIEGYRGIREPSDKAESIDPGDIDLAIVPGLGFDRQCNRLGRGKGYYDRLLPHLRCKTIGICYDCQLLDAIPTDIWDRPLDTVVTPTFCLSNNCH